MAFRCDEILLPAQDNLQPHLCSCADAQLPVEHEILDARQQQFFVIRFNHEIVSSALHATQDVRRIRNRGQQDDWNIFELLVRFDLAAEFVAIHLRQQDGTDNDLWWVCVHGSECQFAIVCNGHRVVVLLKNMPKMFGLCEVLFDNQYFYISTHQPAP